MLIVRLKPKTIFSHTNILTNLTNTLMSYSCETLYLGETTKKIFRILIICILWAI